MTRAANECQKNCHKLLRMWSDTVYAEWVIRQNNEHFIIAAYVPQDHPGARNTCGYCPVCGFYLGFDPEGNPVEQSIEQLVADRPAGAER